MLGNIHQAFQGIWHHKLRSFLTMLGIIIGIAAIITIVSTIKGTNDQIKENLIGSGNVLVQRFGDLIRGRRTNDHRLGQNTVIPTLKATAGDLSLALPHRILTNIIETIYALDKVAPGTANDDTLLYGLESKYYSIKPVHDGDFRIFEGIYLIGDGSGICRGLSQSGATGLYVADRILADGQR